MGWGCYKHEWDAGSENWRAYAVKMCAEHLEKTSHADWGRDAQICPKCYEETIAAHEQTLERLRADHRETVEYLRVESAALAAENARLRRELGEI